VSSKADSACGRRVNRAIRIGSRSRVNLVPALSFRYHPPPMERQPSDTGAQSPAGFANSRFWWLPLLGMLVGHGWLTLGLFGSVDPWLHLLDDEPIISGRHPLHLYHGYLGARAFYEHGSLLCYDPNFQAGYPKTPVFDSGSRPAELFLIASGGQYRPAAYKLGLALSCLLAPLLLIASGRGAGLSWATTCLAVAFGVVVWWSRPARDALEAGDIDLLLAALAALAQLGLLLRFDRAPSLSSWFGILLAGFLGWFAQPLFFGVLLPLTLVYYLSVGARHRLAWHVLLLLAQFGAVAGNAFWLRHWIEYSWLLSPPEAGSELLRHRTFQSIWSAPLWGGPADRALAVVLLAAALIGVVLLNQAKHRAAARLLGFGTIAFLALALLGIAWEPVGRLGAARLLTPSLLFAGIPAAHAFGGAFRLTAHVTGGRLRAAALFLCLLLGAIFGAREYAIILTRRYAEPNPLTLGLSEERQALVTTICRETTENARILWEERPDSAGGSQWSALLPLLTSEQGARRSFVGGLDSSASIEHTRADFNDGMLSGRHISRWTDDEKLLDYCKQYNIGWVVCWSPAAVARMQAWPAARRVSTASAEAEGILFAINRPFSYALTGKANWLQADSEHVTLGDVVPANGKVVLSLHYQAGMKAVPGRVQVEREVDSDDPSGFVRLKVPTAVTRVTLIWDGK
jgi:hypothetical protein